MKKVKTYKVKQCMDESDQIKQRIIELINSTHDFGLLDLILKLLRSYL